MRPSKLAVNFSVELDVRARELSEFKTLFNNVEAKYSATSSNNTPLRAKLGVATGQKRAAEEAQKDVEEIQRAAEEKLKEAESDKQAAQANLLKSMSKCREHQKKSKLYTSKAAHYKSKVDRYHNHILAFTKVRDQTWVNGFSWSFGSLKNFVLNPSTPSPNYTDLQFTDFMDVPEEAIEELRGIGQDLIPDVPD
jgi:chromosome segregation ATPase